VEIALNTRRVAIQAGELLKRIKSDNAPVRKILLNRASLPQDKKREIVVHCEHGQRAALARFFLGLYGYRNTAPLGGDLEDWKKAGLPLET